MRTILLATITALTIASAATPESSPASRGSVAPGSGYSVAHVAKPGSRGTVVEI